MMTERPIQNDFKPNHADTGDTTPSENERTPHPGDSVSKLEISVYGGMRLERLEAD